MAHHFQHVIVNHDGEDSENWNAFYFPLGDARRTLDAFVALLQGFDVQEVEQWEKDFISCTHNRLPLRTLNRFFWEFRGILKGGLERFRDAGHRTL